MENVTNLIAEAQSAIEEFEKYMFTNHLEKYIQTKEFANNMSGKVSYVESMVRTGLRDDNLNEALERINYVINKVSSIRSAYESGKNISLIIDDNGEYVAEEVGTKEALTSFKDDYQPIDTSAVKITDYEGKKADGELEIPIPAEEIVTPVVIEDIVIPDVPSEEAGTIVSGPQVLDDTNGAAKEEDKENFSGALDIAAIDEFLNQGLEEEKNTGIEESNAKLTL